MVCIDQLEAAFNLGAPRLRSAADRHDVRRMREGASPVLNAVSLFLMAASAWIALVLLLRPSRDDAG